MINIIAIFVISILSLFDDIMESKLWKLPFSILGVFCSLPGLIIGLYYFVNYKEGSRMKIILRSVFELLFGKESARLQIKNRGKWFSVYCHPFSPWSVPCRHNNCFSYHGEDVYNNLFQLPDGCNYKIYLPFNGPVRICGYEEVYDYIPHLNLNHGILYDKCLINGRSENSYIKLDKNIEYMGFERGFDHDVLEVSWDIDYMGCQVSFSKGNLVFDFLELGFKKVFTGLTVNQSNVMFQILACTKIENRTCCFLVNHGNHIDPLEVIVEKIKLGYKTKRGNRDSNLNIEDSKIYIRGLEFLQEEIMIQKYGYKLSSMLGNYAKLFYSSCTDEILRLMSSRECLGFECRIKGLNNWQWKRLCVDLSYIREFNNKTKFYKVDNNINPTLRVQKFCREFVYDGEEKDDLVCDLSHRQGADKLKIDDTNFKKEFFTKHRNLSSQFKDYSRYIYRGKNKNENTQKNLYFKEDVVSKTNSYYRDALIKDLKVKKEGKGEGEEKKTEMETRVSKLVSILNNSKPKKSAKHDDLRTKNEHNKMKIVKNAIKKVLDDGGFTVCSNKCAYSKSKESDSVLCSNFYSSLLNDIPGEEDDIFIPKKVSIRKENISEKKSSEGKEKIDFKNKIHIFSITKFLKLKNIKKHFAHSHRDMMKEKNDEARRLKEIKMKEEERLREEMMKKTMEEIKEKHRLLAVESKEKEDKQKLANKIKEFGQIEMEYEGYPLHEVEVKLLQIFFRNKKCKPSLSFLKKYLNGNEYKRKALANEYFTEFKDLMSKKKNSSDILSLI